MLLFFYFIIEGKMSTADMMVISLKININYFEKAIYSQIVESFFFFYHERVLTFLNRFFCINCRVHA